MAEYQLHIGRQKPGVSIRPDLAWRGMWRVHQGDRVSDIVNLSRAKDAAITWARPRGLGSGAVARWHRRETAPEASFSGFSAETALGPPTARRRMGAAWVAADHPTAG